MACNSLELYLEDIYQTELKFEVEKEVFPFVKTGIDTVIENLILTILERYWAGELNNVNKPTDKNIEEFKNENAGLISYDSKELCCFFPLAIFHKEHNLDKDCDIFDGRTEMKDVILQCLKTAHTYPENGDKPQISIIKLESFTDVHFKLHVRYISISLIVKDVYVNLIPVCILVGDFSASCKIENLRTYVEDSGKVIIRKDKDGKATYDFSLTEWRFLRHVLAPNHRKVHLLLEFLVNKYQEKWNKYHEGNERKHTPYLIRTLIIQHHFSCNKIPVVDQCLLDVLYNCQSDDVDKEMLAKLGDELLELYRMGIPKFVTVQYKNETGKGLDPNIPDDIDDDDCDDSVQSKYKLS